MEYSKEQIQDIVDSIVDEKDDYFCDIINECKRKMYSTGVFTIKYFKGDKWAPGSSEITDIDFDENDDRVNNYIINAVTNLLVDSEFSGDKVIEKAIFDEIKKRYANKEEFESYAYEDVENGDEGIYRIDPVTGRIERWARNYKEYYGL